MSNLIPRLSSVPATQEGKGAVSTPLADPNAVQWVEVQHLPSGDQGEEVDLSEMWRSLKRRRRLVAATAGAIVAATLIITAYQRLFAPVYEGTLDLLITDPVGENNRGGGGAGLGTGTIFEQLALGNKSADTPTLIEVLRSPLLLEPIATKYGETYKDLDERIKIATGGTRQSEAEGVLKISITGKEPKTDQLLLQDLSKAYLKYSLAQRQQRLTEGLNFLDRQAPSLEANTNRLQAELASFRRRNNLLQPIEEGAALKIQLATLTNQLGELKADRSRLLSVQSSIENGTLTAQGFQEAIGTSNTGQANQVKGEGLSVAGTGQALLEQLTKLEQQLAEAQARFTPSSAIVRGLQARRDGMIPLLRRNQLEAVSAALNLNANRIKSLERQIAGYTATFQLQPALIKEFEGLQQRLTIAQENQAGFIKARENFQLEIAQRSVPWSLIATPRINPKPVKPSVSSNLALGVILGLIGGVAAGLIRDRFDHVFHNPSEVRDDLKQPLLGHVPHVAFFKGVREDRRYLLAELDKSTTPEGTDASEQQRKAIGYQRFFYQEAFRNLYTSLRFLNSDRPLRSIAITSSQPSEGKSLVNILLAKTLSEMGQRVLIVDSDLRKPQLHQRLGLDNLIGLSNLLSGDADRWQDAIQPVPGYSNWFALTSGRRPPDPARLLGSPRMADFVREVAESGQFDLILYDTPPVLGLADALLVAEQLDGMMLLVSLSRVDRSLPRESIERIRTAGAPLLGILTNAIKEEKQRDGSYGYGYGYGRYGKSYGYGSHDYRTAYAYYGTDDSSPGENPATETLKAAKQKPKGKSWTRKLMGWLDQ